MVIPMIIQDLQQLPFPNVPGFVGGIKDKNSASITMTAVTAQILGFNSVEETIGMTDYDIPGPVAEFAEDFIAQDKAVLAHEKVVDLFDIHQYANEEIHSMLGKKGPAYNSENKLIGIYAFGMLVPAQVSALICLELMKTQIDVPIKSKTINLSYSIKDSIPENSISERELECLFLLLRNKSNKQIAAYLNLSVRTVEFYFSNLRNKLSCSNKYELLDVACKIGIHRVIPKRLFQQNLSVILSD